MQEVKLTVITPEVLESAYNYQQFRDKIDELLADNKTTGENHSEAMIHYTTMNVHRMKRLDKQITLNEELRERLQKIDREMVWLVLTEAWCGDAAQIIPLLERMAEVSGKITLKFILRDENLEIMDQFLTNGRSRSIPKVICLDAKTLEVLGDWGPRPEEAQELYNGARNIPNIASQEVAERLHKWYAKNKTKSAQEELLSILDDWE
jgi:thioredoxin-like negative regulator of GroEL